MRSMIAIAALSSVCFMPEGILASGDIPAIVTDHESRIEALEAHIEAATVPVGDMTPNEVAWMRAVLTKWFHNENPGDPNSPATTVIEPIV